MGTNRSDNESSGMPEEDVDNSHEGRISGRHSNLIIVNFGNRSGIQPETEQTPEDIVSKLRQEVADRFEMVGKKLYELPNKILDIMVCLGVINREDIIRNGKSILIRTKDGLVTPEQCLQAKIDQDFKLPH